nr:MAG TPA: hypothetical protein [Caudoviricetes sp.]
MAIGELIKANDIDIYRRLQKMCKRKKQKKIELGDRPEKLMKVNSYKRCGRRIRQVKWG